MNFERAFHEYFMGYDFTKLHSRRSWPLNIIFWTASKITDETQFDLYPEEIDVNNYACEDLKQCWHEFCMENCFDEDSIIAIELLTSDGNVEHEETDE